MSRFILCLTCAADKQEGVRKAFEGNKSEPPEYERVVFGIAAVPKPEQRVMFISGEPQPLDPNSYTCDTCGNALKPGERICAWTIWLEDQEDIFWEREYFKEPVLR